MSNSRRPAGRGRGGSAARKPRVAGARNRAASSGDTRTSDVVGDAAAEAPGEVSTEEPVTAGAVDAAPTETVSPVTSSGASVSEATTELPAKETELPAAAGGADAVPGSAPDDLTTRDELATRDEPATRDAPATPEGSTSPEGATSPEDEAAEQHHDALSAHEGEALDSDGSGSDAPDTDGSDPKEPASGAGAATGSGSVRSSRKVLTAVLLALTVGFAGLACWFQYSAHSLRHGGAAANRALVDESATSEVKGQVGKAVEKIFSFDYSNMDKTEQAAGNVLVGDSVEQYDKMFETVREQAPKQKMVLTTTVAESGVTMLQDGRAEVLLFVNQNATRTGSGEGGVYPAQLSVVAVKRDGQWKISSMTQL
ncbi:hypothetical protein ACOQFL_03825 [Actinopolyspora sp. H202]|uniref:hypothetical protein n=1 Tax=Actinopolyspora sp. H202 TaxID=1500456 RepID=UPI003EE69DD6